MSVSEITQMPANRRRLVDGKLLRCGYTTGTCAAAAAKAATEMLLSSQLIKEVSIIVPSGETPEFEILNADFSENSVSCAIKKDSGDDPDVTDGVLVYATATRISKGIKIDGGEGVGRVTKPGLDQPVGNAAINSVPRMMIEKEILSVCEKYNYIKGISVIIAIPGGDELARRTFNTHLGITGGLSILGTSGIVEPMSNTALIGAIRTELQVLAASGDNKLLLTIGNFGERFAQEILKLPLTNQIKCGNLIGETLAAAVELNFKQIMIIGHIGKLVKLGLGVINTHSSNGDGRREALIACALRAGADIELLRKLDDCVTTESGIALIREAGLLSESMSILGNAIEDTLKRHIPPEIQIEYVCFIEDEILIQSREDKDMFSVTATPRHCGLDPQSPTPRHCGLDPQSPT